jgi:hypothetical protein
MRVYMKLVFKVVNFGTSKNQIVRSTEFHIVKFVNTLGLLLMEEI